ncbi:peptidase domain-containing ABC transporter [Wenyingzhuangia sp. IMCC45533]
MKKNYPHYHQYDFMDCGPTSLKMICKYHGKSVDLAYLREISYINGEGTTMAGIVDAAEKIGFSTLGLTANFDILANELPLPCIVHWRERHYAVVYEIKKNKVIVGDPANYDLITYTKEEFLEGWGVKRENSEDEGVVLLLEPTPELINDKEDTQKDHLFKFIYSYLKPHKRYVYHILVGLFFGTIIQFTFPFLTQQIVDTGINKLNLNFVYLVLIAQIILFSSELGLTVYRNWIVLHITSRMNLRMLSDFMIKLMKLPIKYFDSRAKGDILQRIEDNNEIHQFLSTTTLNVLFSAVTLFVFCLILAYFDITLLLVFTIGSIFYVSWIRLFMKKRSEMNFRHFDQKSKNKNTTIELISGMQEIKLNGSEQRRRWDWESLQARMFKLDMRSMAIDQSQNEGGRFIDQIKNVTITFIAAKAVINGTMTLGTMLSVQYIIGQMNVPIHNFLGFIRDYQDARLSLLRLNEIHQKKNEEPLENSYINELSSDKSLSLKNLSYRYGSSASKMVLNNVNIHIPEGKTTALVGASGSGKTTLLKLLLQYDTPTEGEILVGNYNLNQMGNHFWRSNCGVVMQDGHIFSDTIARNVSESDIEGKTNRKNLMLAAHTANIHEFVEELPNGYSTKIGSNGIGLSGGQKQRILIARAVYKNPEYIFFDEATSALDANNEVTIMKNLDNFFKGKNNKTVVVVAHRLSTVKNADQIIVLDRGKVVEQGNHKELVALEGHYYTLVKNQLELGS